MGAIIVQLGSARRHAAPGRLGAAAKLPFYTTEPPQFANPVHCVRQTRDGLLYVCDRANKRIQVFRKNGQFVRRFTLEPKTPGSGSAWDLIPTEDAAQKYPQVASRKTHLLVAA
jgi:NHL repeat